jgi:hypothetical protein
MMTYPSRMCSQENPMDALLGVLVNDRDRRLG